MQFHIMLFKSSSAVIQQWYLQVYTVCINLTFFGTLYYSLL